MTGMVLDTLRNEMAMVLLVAGQRGCWDEKITVVSAARVCRVGNRNNFQMTCRYCAYALLYRHTVRWPLQRLHIAMRCTERSVGSVILRSGDLFPGALQLLIANPVLRCHTSFIIRLWEALESSLSQSLGIVLTTTSSARASCLTTFPFPYISPSDLDA